MKAKEILATLKLLGEMEEYFCRKPEEVKPEASEELEEDEYTLCTECKQIKPSIFVGFCYDCFFKQTRKKKYAKACVLCEKEAQTNDFDFCSACWDTSEESPIQL